METFLDLYLVLPESMALGVFKMLFFITEDFILDFLFKDCFLDTREVLDFVAILAFGLTLSDFLLKLDFLLNKLFLLATAV